MPAERAGAEIECALAELRQFLDLDRVTLYEIINRDDKFRLKYSASIGTAPAAPQSFSHTQFPWLLANLMEGKDAVIRSPENLPPDARKEQAFLLDRNYRFGVIVPLKAAGVTLAGLAFISYRDTVLPEKVIQRLHVVAEVFANSLMRKRIEEGLHESQQRFEMMANSAPVMIWMSGTDKLFTFFNQRWLSYTGRSLEQEMGNAWVSGVHPSDMDECVRTYKSWP